MVDHAASQHSFRVDNGANRVAADACPSRTKGTFHQSFVHPPPPSQLPEGAVCCGTRAAEKFQTEAKFLNPFENDNPAAGDEEVAVMRYTDTWLG